jgi:hypothetical protein
LSVSCTERLWLETLPPTNVISGIVWINTNRDGLYDENTPIAGAFIQILNSNGDVLQNTTSNANGTYSFTVAPDLNYTVHVSLIGNPSSPLSPVSNPLSTLNPTTPFVGGNPSTESQGTLTTDLTYSTSPLIPATSDQTVNFGFSPIDISDVLFCDVNVNGVYDNPPDSGIAGVTVQLYITSTTLNLPYTLPYLYLTTTTGSNGYYTFSGVYPDTTMT